MATLANCKKRNLIWLQELQSWCEAQAAAVIAADDAAYQAMADDIQRAEFFAQLLHADGSQVEVLFSDWEEMCDLLEEE